MSDKYDLAVRSTDEITVAGSSYSGHNVVMIDASGVPVKDSVANFVSKSGSAIADAGASYTGHNVVMIDANGVPVKDTVANFVSKSGSAVASGNVYHAFISATGVEINAGKEIIPAPASGSLRITDMSFKITTELTSTGESFIIRSDDATPTVVATISADALPATTYIEDGSTKITYGAGKGATLEAGAGLEIVASTGGVATSGVCIADVSYVIVP